MLGKDIRVCNSMQCDAVDIRMVRGAVEQEQQLPLMTALPRTVHSAHYTLP